MQPALVVSLWWANVDSWLSEGPILHWRVRRWVWAGGVGWGMGKEVRASPFRSSSPYGSPAFMPLARNHPTMSLLSDTVAERIVSASRTALGESCRSVTYFTKDDYEQLYLRDDLEQDADLTDFIGHEWRGFRLAQSAYAGSELGAYRFTMRAFEDGYLIRVTNDREGVFVTTDQRTLHDFETVADALSETMREDLAD